jgi:amino acid adenylation domain-containing protein
VNLFRSVCDGIREMRNASTEVSAIKCGALLLSYEELNFRAECMAGYLSQVGAEPGSTVAICMDRSIDWIVAAMGILLAGAAYVPLDPTWPEARLRYAVEDSGAAVLIAPVSLLNRLHVSARGIDLTRDAARIAATPPLESRAIEPGSLAYVIYTSGSTGAPKGVEITHANLSHLIDWHIEAFKLTANDCVSHLAGLGFDAAVWDIWPALSAGATLCIPDDTVRLSSELIQEWMMQCQVTIGFVPTVHAARLIEMKWPANTALRTLLTGGDTLPHPPGEDLPFEVVNNYGPTECTVVATSGVISPESTGTPVIGRAIAGASIYLLDEDGRPVEDGQGGEIYIGGSGVGRGYRNLPDATSKSFLPDTFSRMPGALMYRSGDRGVRRANGEIEFHGRADRQVKIRGQRIELDEIGNRLNLYPAVQFAIVTADGAREENTDLTGYVLLKDESQGTTASELREYLLKHLPSYMVPSRFLRLRALPVSANGKIDLALLPAAVVAPLASRESVRNAGNEVQATLLAAARELLKDPEFGLKDDFFLAGGHSLLSMQLIMRLRSAYGVDITLRQLFDGPTVENLSLLVERKLAQVRLAVIWKELLKIQECGPDANFVALGGNGLLIEELQRRIASEFGRYVTDAELAENQTLAAQAELVCRAKSESLLPQGVVAVQAGGQRNSIFWLHYPCPKLSEALGEERPFLCLTLTEDDFEILGDEPTLEEIARCLVPRILAAQPKGPYIVGGFCVGGLLSYEVGCQLQAAGYEVSLLILLDTPSPEYCRRAEPRTIMRTIMSRPAYLVKRIKQLGIRMSLANLLDRASRKMRGDAEGAPELNQGERMQHILETAAFHYKPTSYEGKVALIMASEMPPGWEPAEHFMPWWRSLIQKTLHTHLVEGLHEDLVTGSATHKVAEAITYHLEQAEQAIASTLDAELATEKQYGAGLRHNG